MMILTTQFREQNKLSWFCFLVAAVFVSVSSKHLTDEENDKYECLYSISFTSVIRQKGINGDLETFKHKGFFLKYEAVVIKRKYVFF